MKKIARIQLITQENDAITHQECILNGLKAGVKWIQLRVKDKSEKEVEELALWAKNECESYNCTLILNDYAHLVKKLDLDGVHLGLTDMSTLEARKILGEDKIIGGTANTMDDVFYHYKNEADYIGLGPYKFTQTKDRLSPVLGLEGYRRVLENLKSRNMDLPVIAIGGIKKEDVPKIVQTGVYGIALASELNFSKKLIEDYTEMNSIF